MGGKVWGDVAVDIGFARGGVRLKGFLLETKFPITLELVFSKYPLDIGYLDSNLIGTILFFKLLSCTYLIMRIIRHLLFQQKDLLLVKRRF